MVEVKAEVPARSLFVGVTLRWRGEVLNEEELTGLFITKLLDAVDWRDGDDLLLTFLTNQKALSPQNGGKKLKRRELG